MLIHFTRAAGQLALTDNRFKLVHQPSGKGRPGRSRNRAGGDEALEFMLFDLAADPAESKDVAQEHPEAAARMKAALLEWRKSHLRSLAGEDYAK